MRDDSDNGHLDSKSFDAIAGLAYRESGLQLVAEKSSMIQSRLRHRLKAVGLNSFESYANYVGSKDGARERVQMISALTTNVSHFFREKHHFEMMVERILRPRLQALTNGGRLRIWSAGCSNRQEALSIAITVLEAFPESRNLDFKVLATDIDPNVITFASKATYPERLVSSVPESSLSKYFTPVKTQEGAGFRACGTLLDRIFFSQLNLLGDWPMAGLMDAIFCRNVVIYFDQLTQENLWPRFHKQLRSDGCLFLGHSERIADPESKGFTPDGPTTYRPSGVHSGAIKRNSHVPAR